MALNDIDHVVFLMLENRSFDHMLGYLSLDETEHPLPVDGLRSDKAWQAPFANGAVGKSYPIKHIKAKQPINQDPPHGFDSIRTQIATAPAGPGRDKMGGFVSTYVAAHAQIDDPGVVMGYYKAEDVPVFDFLARNFCVCDNWFTPLPLGTQANRLMAMAGESRVLDNVTFLLPPQDLVYDWLNREKIAWRAYTSGGFTPFFMLMRRWAPRIFKSIATQRGPFQRLSSLEDDWAPTGQAPSVIFIEPEYADAPMSDPNDDHPPTPIAKGQALVRRVYETLTSNPARWQRTLLIVTYDEHGGFFDHVPPLEVDGLAGATKLETTGPRVPALLISPHVTAGQVFSEPLDHTSVLELIGERFGSRGAYSPAVSARQQHFGRLADALQRGPRPEAAPSMPAPRLRPAGKFAKPIAPTAPNTPNAAAIDAIMRELAAKNPKLINQPAWSDMKLYLDTNMPPEPVHKDNIGDASEL